ncbi:GIP [Symbiodinium sp. CCMP2592]|nr:GIP [Symbiodinium sp. CCMP2592]
MSGISPPSEDRSRSRTSGESSFSDPELFSGQALVPAAATILRIREPAPTPQRNEGYSSSSAASPPQRGPELSATQATFLAGAAVTHAHHASGVALGAASLAHQAAEREQQTVTQAREAVMQASLQAAAAEAQYRDEAQTIARAAQGIVDDARYREASLRQEAQSAIDATTREAQQRVSMIQGEAQQAIAQSNHSAQARIRLVEGEARGLSEALRQATLAREQAEVDRQEVVQRLRQRDADIVRLADEMESMQRRHEEAMAVMAERYRDLSAKFVESSNAQAQRTPTRTRLSFPEMSFSPDTSQNDAVQQPTTPVIEPVPEEQETLSTPLVAQPTGESDAPQEGAAAGAPGGEASSGPPEDPQPISVDQRVDELAKLVSDLAKLVAASAAQSGSAAAPSGAAPSAPAEAQSDSPPQVPTLNLGGTAQVTAPPGSPGSGGSSSSSSSSDSSARSEHPACRMCGSKKHAEEECPELTCNKDGGDDPAPDGDGAAASSAAAPKTNAELEEDTIRVKSLSDLSFPNPPQNAAQARGFVNQTLMAIGKLQKTPGDEVYIWAQDCLKKEPAALCKDGRFPRLDREIAAKLIKVCRHGRFGLLFQQMVESERLKSGGMPNGRCMLRAIYRHFQLERDRMGMLAERNLLNIKIGGDGISHLEAFRDKYHYVANTIPVEDLPKDSTIFNHLIDEFEKVSVLKPKVEKAREARPGSHRRTAAWLWNRVDIAIDLHQQRVNRQEFDKSLQQKPETLTSTSQPSKPSVPATPAPGAAAGAPKGGTTDKPPKKEKKKKKKKKKDEGEPEVEVPGAPAPKGKGKGGKGGKGNGTPRSPKGGDTTPRSAQAKSARNMTPEEKAKTPCMFWAFGACKGDPCPFLHDSKNKYTGPKPKSLAKPDAKAKPKAKAKANAATAPLINALPAELNQDGKITWLWDTAAGRHLIGRQALSSKALSCVTRSETPVGFATGGGAREGTHSLAFEGSRLLPSEEQVYVLKECPPAFSVGKAVLDEGSLFVWDPREHRPYFVKKEDVHRCKLRIPRKARINATRVVEYVPQFEETLRPAVREQSPSLSPITASASPAPKDDDTVSFSDFEVADLEEAEASYPRTTSGDYDWEADVVEKHAEKKAEAKRLFREGAVGETAASESSEEELFPELFKGKPASTQQPAEGTTAKEAASGLFLGWRIDAGMRYRNVVKVLDYNDFRGKRNTSVHDVPEPELYIEDGPPIFPVANATRKALVDGSTLSAASGALPEIPLREIPFALESIGPPADKEEAAARRAALRALGESPETPARGKDLELTGLYTQEMCERIAFAINPSRAYISVPAMPILPTSTTTEHREKEQELKHVSALSGYEDLAAVIESDQEASKLVEEVVDLSALMCAVHGIPKEAPSKEVSAMVTKLLSRAEMLSSPEALKAVKQEADGLRAVPVWDETNPQEYASVQAQARRTGTKVHFGKLMSIASIKFWELAKHLQKVKGRIVYRGDCAKDEEGAAAVYRELGANPTSVQGLNACLAYGSLPGHQSSAADAVKAYVQALLKSKYQTWIELPPELRPAWWRECFAKPVVLLLRALYGHPEAGGLWEKHLKEVLRNMGGQELPEYPGNFWFPETKLLLSTYVDDLTLSGPQEEHQPFWDALCKVVDVEPPEPVYRILGRNHCTINAELEGTENAALGALKGAMAFDMFDYAQQTVDLYKGLTGLKTLKHAATPFAPEASLPVSQEEIAGELAPNACKVLMKALWLGRLARPDLVKPIGDLATKVQKWSRNDDKKLLRLISYIDSTKTHRLVGTVSDGPRELHLALYVDADFAGERDDAKSTSGGFLVLKGPNTFFPLAWVSKRQTSVSRSTPESEIVSLAHSLFQEALPALQLWQTILDYPIRLVIHEDNQATILVAKKGYSPKLRHIARTHKVNLGSISEVIDEDDVDIEYVDTNLQAADIFTKALPPQKWDNALKLLGMRQKLPEILVDTRQLKTKAGSGPTTSPTSGSSPK